MLVPIRIFGWTTPLCLQCLCAKHVTGEDSLSGNTNEKPFHKPTIDRFIKRLPRTYLKSTFEWFFSINLRGYLPEHLASSAAPRALPITAHWPRVSWVGKYLFLTGSTGISNPMFLSQSPMILTHSPDQPNEPKAPPMRFCGRNPCIYVRKPATNGRMLLLCVGEPTITSPHLPTSVITALW